MCESSVYLVKGSERSLVMADVARIVVSDAGITCVSTIGDRTTVQDVELAEANLVKHEIMFRPRKG